MKKLKAAIDLPILATTALAAALLALGIGFLAPTGEQSKLEYEGNLWCVSNFIEQEPTEYLADGRPRQDPLLDSREDWIVRDQVKADTKEQAEAEARANGHGLFEPSNKDELRAKITANDKAFFTTHFNTGATMAGPCWGTGSTTRQAGRWLNEAINQQCGFNNNSGYEEVSGRPTQAIITAYSPNMPGNTCDAKTGGSPSTADGGSFKVVNGRLRYVKGSTVEDYVFAQPSDNPIIAWDQIENQAVILDGFNNNQPIHIRDHYAPGLHAGQNYLDLFLPCSEYGSFNQGQTHKITVVDLAKPKPKITNTPNAKLPDGSKCPDSALPEGPSYGKDYEAEIAKAFEKQYSILTAGGGSGTEESDSNYEGPAWENQNLPEGVLNVPAIDESKYGLIGRCNRAAAGMAYLYRTGKQVWSGIGEWLKGLGPTSSILAQVGTGVVVKNQCASADNWAEIREQVLVKKNPVVLATSYGSKGMHFLTIVGFQGNEVYFNDGAHFVGSGSGVKARHTSVSDLNQHLHHATVGCQFLYAK